MSAEQQAPQETRAARTRLRRVLFAAGPLLLVTVAGALYLTAGRYVDTENAYIRQDKVLISAQVSGPVTGVEVSENQAVARGQLLFRIDPAPYRVALERARAGLASARAGVHELQAAYREAQETLALDRSNEAYAEREYSRLQKLAGREFTSQDRLEEAKHDLDVARGQVAIAQRKIEQLLAQLGGRPGLPVAEQPACRQARAVVEQAELDLAHTRITAPFDGVAHNVPEPGQYVESGGAVMAVVSTTGTWIEANFKETALTHVTVGQPVRIEVDTYPGRTWRGAVQSISQATGAEFSVLPAQNATGNWVKVVQRIPVRISVRAQEGAPKLRAGMSTSVRIDTGEYRHLPQMVQNLMLRWRPQAVYVADAKAADPK